MRSVNRFVLAALAASLAACGNYSTEDLRFLAALPTKDDLRVEVPTQSQALGAPGALTACAAGTAEVWLWAKPTSDGLNASVAFVLGLVDLVRRETPSAREENVRGWGPWDDEKHPGRELRVFIFRSYPAELAGAPRHAYAFQARVKGTATDWTTILAGTFDGASAERGAGTLLLDFDAIRALGLDDPETPRGTELVRYDRGAEPATVEILLGAESFGVVSFAYQYAGWRDGTGWFAYAFRNPSGDLFVVGSGFDGAGAGDAQIGFRTAAGFEGGYRQCWSPDACLVHVADPGNYSCAAPPCSSGDASACPIVPSSPFPG
jgi:hypothetical protein